MSKMSYCSLEEAWGTSFKEKDDNLNNKYEKIDNERLNVISNMNNIERNNNCENNSIIEYEKYRFNPENKVLKNDVEKSYSPFKESIEKKYLQDKLNFLENEFKKYKHFFENTNEKSNSSTIEKFENEFNTQLEIYNISYQANYFSNADKYDAICPRPIHRTIELISYVDTLLNKITTDDKNKKNLSDMFSVIKSNNVSHVGILYMEMMEGWYLLEEVLDSTRLNERRKIFFKNMFRYVIDRLHNIGFLHGDPHLSNAMVNLKYPYLTNTNNLYFGRVILIDFGKTRRISQKEEGDLFDDEKIFLRGDGIYYQGIILDNKANYKTIKELRSKFNEEREKEREKKRMVTEFDELENYIIEKVRDIPAPIRLPVSTIEPKPIETKPTSWFASSARSARSARSALSTLSKIPSFLSRTTRTTKVLPVESTNQITNQITNPITNPITNSRTNHPDVRYHLGGQQRARPSYVNTRRRRHRKKLPTKHKRVTRVTSRKKRNSKNNL
jgi:hypothetical protein